MLVTTRSASGAHRAAAIPRSFWAWALALHVLLSSGATGVCAQATQASTHIGRGAVPAVDHVLVPVPAAAPVALAGTVGYGVTESQEGEGAHDRLDGTLAASLAPLPELVLAFALDARFDWHPRGSEGAIVSPRILARYVFALSDRLRLGAAGSFALAGGEGPSLALAAPVLGALGLLGYRLAGHWELAAQLGYRFDRSAAAAPDDLAGHTRAERMGLGLSDFDALPLGVALLHQRGKLALAAELSGEILVGSGSPGLQESPLRAALIARWPLGDGWALEGLARLALSARPEYTRVLPLIPVEPRLTIALGVRFVPPQKPPPAAKLAPERSDFSGEVHDEAGEPVAAAHLSLQIGGETYAVQTDAAGRFGLRDLPRGAAELLIAGDDIIATHRHVLLDRTAVELSIDVARRMERAQLRGLVRSFDGAALPAHVHVLPAGASVTADNAGRFMLELPPGVYQVEIEC
ncbi:MAG: carboxypeptidase-like regulatory domain-containing protein, partial [Polyangiales bacterium]